MATDYLVGFYFELSLDGENIAFKEVSGISKELGIEEVKSGGENRFKYRLPTITSSKNLVLKRAIAPNNSSLVKWCSDTLDGGLTQPIRPQDLTVNLLNEKGEVLMKWLFYKAYPVKYAIADLKSRDNEVLVESVELAYTYFEVKTIK
ncbi:phage tail protein [Psychroserpens sp. MEBiC05023]